MKNDAGISPAQLQDFQKSYSRYLRAPAEVNLDDNIPVRRSRLYEELLFNNVCGFLDRCFPVARSLLDESSWRRLNREFYRDWQCHTPYFSRIPWEFVQYVSGKSPAGTGNWFSELLDYEWRELEADIHPAVVPPVEYATGKNNTLQINPTLQNLQYEWPVHQISKSFLPSTPKPTFLLVYRRFDHRVEFMEINALTSALLQILQQQPASTEVLIATLADLMPGANLQTLRDFGKPLLLDLLQKNVVVFKYA